MEGLPQTLPQDAELTIHRLLDGDAPVAHGSLAFHQYGEIKVITAFLLP